MSDAEDVCQEVFVKALLADRSGVKNMKAWLIRIAVNESKSLLSRRAKGRDKERSLFLSERTVLENPVETAAEQHELSRQFDIMFGRLPLKIRQVMTRGRDLALYLSGAVRGERNLILNWSRLPNPAKEKQRACP